MDEKTALPDPANATNQAPDAPAPPEAGERTPDQIKEGVVAALHTIYDPEIPVDIYELGLIYEVEIREGSQVHVRMTLTSPMCPAAEILPAEVESKSRAVEGVLDFSLDLVWDPPWDPSMMSEAAKLELGF